MRTTILLFLLAVAGEAASQVSYILVDKSRRYDQTSPTTVTPTPPRTPCNFQCGFAFSARVGGTTVGAISAPTVTGPIDSASLGSVWRGGVMGLNGSEWQLFFPPGGEWNGPTQADIDAKFANGTYTITVQGQAYPLNLTGDAYPEPPVMTVTSPGQWVDGKFVFDPRAPITVTTSTVSVGPPDGMMGLYACLPGAGGSCFHAPDSPGPTRTRSFPANTFAEGAEPFFVTTFRKLVDQAFHAPPASSHSWASYNSGTQLNTKAQVPQRFPVTVTANITPTVANATATFQPLPQDVGTSANVYVFAVAPATRVTNASVAKAASFGTFAKGTPKDTPVPCVLAQLNASGQLQAVSAANLAAYASGVLTSQGQTVPILNSVPTSLVTGSTFYVGYGASPTQMITNGVNQRALSVAGDVACDPKPPQTGWWWNTSEGGRGYSIETSGTRIFFAAYLYDVSGRATWTIAAGNTSLDGSLFVGRLESYAGGQALASPYRAPGPVSYIGDLTLAFSDAAHGTLVWPGGSMPIERFNIVANGTALPVQSNQPESGWWWNPEESGRGYFMEWQGGQLFMAGYMYDADGNPIWYLAQDVEPDATLQTFSGQWWQFANGPALTGPFRQATRVSDNVAPVTIQFSGAETGIVTLPGGRTAPIRRYRF